MFRSTHGLMSLVIFFSLQILFLSCKRGPETQDPFLLELKPGMVESVRDIRWAEHEVVVREVIPITNNLFLKVEEGSDTYWLATALGNIKPGNTYYYNEAVVTYDFESVELDRKFDSIYLVTQLLPESRKNELKRLGLNPHQKDPTKDQDQSEQEVTQTDQVQRVTLSELLESPKRFENTRVEISGTCTKVNAGIMGRNWIHVMAESEDEKKIVATSSEMAEVGAPVTLQAVVRLNKDFGSGYFYAILLEEAVIIK